MKDQIHKFLQNLILRSKDWPLFSSLYLGIYSYAEKTFVSFTLNAQKSCGLDIIESIYLRRGGGRGELIPGASDLDFFIVLRTISAEQELLFLKEFWARYRKKRQLLPFLGETLMGDCNELENWFQTKSVRAFETSYSWKHLWGEKTLAKLPAPAAPDLREVFSECLKCYWSLLQPVLKLQPENLQTEIHTNSYGAIHLRHALKAAIDLFRMHYCYFLQESDNEKFKIISKASREELLTILPPDRYSKYLTQSKSLLQLRSAIFDDKQTFTIFSDIIFHACKALHELAEKLEKESAEEKVTGKNWQVVYHAKKGEADNYSLSVRELFAERILFRHQEIMNRAVLSESTAHMYFPMHGVPAKEKLQELLLDLRDVSFSLERFSVPMPVSELCFKQIEKTSLLDTPFHSFYSHKELVFQDDGNIQTHNYQPPSPEIPESMLRKTFAELSFTLRQQPELKHLDHFLEKIVTMVLSLRISYDLEKIVTDFYSALDIFAKKYPSRSDHLCSKISVYLYLKQAAEEELWAEIDALLKKFSERDPRRANFLETQIRQIRSTNMVISNSQTLVTDLWTNITPFLRMEMNAIKDKVFPIKPRLRI